MDATIPATLDGAARTAASYLAQNALRLLHEPWWSGSRFYWVYCCSFFAFAAVAYAASRNGDERWSLRRFLAYCFPRAQYLHPSALVDYKLIALNAVLSPWTLVTSIVSVAAIAAWVQAVTQRVVGASGVLPWNAATAIAFTFAMMVTRDFAFYVDHVLKHRIPVLWEFHKVHHSAEVLTPFTIERKHPVAFMMMIPIVFGAVGVCQGVAAALFFGGIEETTLFGINAFVALSNLAGAHLRHSHLWLSFGRLDRVLVSPAVHQVHHSAAAEHRGKNYGETFTVFDWLFGTLYLPRREENLVFGLGPDEPQPHGTVLRAYVVPFVNAARIVARAVPLGRATATARPPLATVPD